jgi:hypothetical protein
MLVKVSQYLHDNSQLRTSWSSDLNRQHIAREGPRVDTSHNAQTHRLCSLIDDFGQLTEVIDRLVERLQFSLFLDRAVLVRSDRDGTGGGL